MGPVDQISDGQNRVNQTGLTAGQYSIDATGGLSDASGRGCIFTAPTSQFQCDMGATPSPGFSVGCDGTLAYENGTEFIACPTGDNGGYNLYATAPGGQQDCVSTALTADNCQSGCPAAATAPAKTCPLDLSGAYEVSLPMQSGVQFNQYMKVSSSNRPCRFVKSEQSLRNILQRHSLVNNLVDLQLRHQR